MEFIRENQSNVMLMIAGIIFIVILFTLGLKFINTQAKRALIGMEVSAFVMVVMDRLAYKYRGDTTTLGFYMVRISNFLVFLMILTELASFARYVIATIREKNEDSVIPKLLYWSQFFILGGVILLIVSQFTGLYYTFDETNHYVRGKYYPVCYIIPTIIFVLLMITIMRLYKQLNHRLRFLLLLFPISIFCASIVQFFVYGISLNTLTFCVLTILLFRSALIDLNHTIADAQHKEIEALEKRSDDIRAFFVQTVEALVSAIDAKDKYTHGHSARVAEYSARLAKMAGKNDDECEEIYFSGILHDVGKIGIPDAIINKNTRLTDEEYAVIKSHPVKGGQILSRITHRPYLSIGAKYHHERYDGKGYPEHLKGDDIPEMARIISIADAYDAMTSKRSYRDPVPQQKVREEIIKGMGTQFDPKYAKLMLELIDADTSYEMKEKEAIEQLDGKSELECGGYMENISTGFRITDHIITIKFNCTPLNINQKTKCVPSLIAFDSLNGRVYKNKTDAKAEDYYEYGVILLKDMASGIVTTSGVREKKVTMLPADNDLKEYQYCIKAVRYRDHMLAIIDNGAEICQLIFALSDCARFFYFALTGEHCVISDITESVADEAIGPDYIPRIAPPIVYLDLPDGDIPNVEIDNYRTASSEPIQIDNKVTMDFTYKSYPFSTRIWHCPMIRIYSSDDGKISGGNYKEYCYVRFDGESWNETGKAVNKLTVVKDDDFESWDKWKKGNKKGVFCHVDISRENNKVKLETKNGGIFISNITEITEPFEKLYVNITGDQCAVSNIRIQT